MKTNKPRLPRHCFVRWAVRLAAAFLLLVALILLYLNQVGLPEFAKIRLQAELQARGWNVEVKRIRWQPFKRQLMAEGVQWRAGGDDFPPSASARKLEIHLRSWFALPPKIKAVTLHNGALDLPFSASENASALRATNVQTKLSFADPRYWEMEISAQCLGVDINLWAQVTNTYAFKNWRSQSKTEATQWRNLLRQIVQTHESLGFARNPSLQIRLNYDAAHPQKSTARIELLCDRAKWNGLSLEAENIQLHAHWKAEMLVVEQLAATLYNGNLDFQGTWNPKTRRTTLAGHFDFDAQRIRHLLSDKGKRWLNQYKFQKPPFVQIQASAILPKQGNGDSGWWKKLQSSLNLAGRFHADKASFRTVHLDSVSSSVEFSNMTWSLPDIRITRPEGELRLNYQCDTRTKDHRWEIDGVVDWNAYKPLLTSAQTEKLALFEFTQPVHIRNGKVRGRWGDPNLTQFETNIAVTNFLFRDVPLSSLCAALAYTNKLLTATHVELHCKEGQIRADEAKVNFDTRLVTTTNAISTASPSTITKMIGPTTEQFLKQYRFLKPPRIQLNGTVPLDAENPAAARFQVEGPFALGRFQSSHIRADINWIGRKVKIQNIAASFYQGSLKGNMNLSLTANRQAAFNLYAKIKNVDLNALFADALLEKDKKSQGTLNGEITIHSGQTDNWSSWQGHGQASLEKGFLWDAPLFGIFSHLLNAFSPGLGSSRAESGQASFTIVDGVIRTPDLIIQEPSVRLRYEGNIDFRGNLDAKVEAELLRDMPMIGQALSVALWPVSKLFVYKVSGNLRDPVVEPKYIFPKLLTNPIHSILNPLIGNRRNPKPTPPEPAATD